MRTLTIQPTSRVLGASSGSPARQLLQELERDFGLSKHSVTEYRARKLEYSDGPRSERPPVELRDPNVVSVQRDFRTGQQTIKYVGGRTESRAFIIAPDLVRPSQPLRESPRVILAAAEARLERLNREAKKTPKEILEALERRYGLTPSGVLPLSDSEFELYRDRSIRRPDNFDERLRLREQRKHQEQKAEVADLKRRWEVLKRTKMCDTTYIAKQPEY
jgi:hypothetical protein